MNFEKVNWGPAQLPHFVLICGCILGIIGPFEQSYRFDLFERIGLWITYFTLSAPLLWGACSAIYERIWPLTPLGRVGVCALISLVSSPPILAIVEILGYTQGRPFPSDLVAAFFAACEVFIVTFPVCLFFVFLKYQALAKDAPMNTVCKSVSPLNDAFRLFGEDVFTSLYALRAEGHYTRAYGAWGEKLIDKTFSDMLEIVAPLSGAQVHRSWWVAKDQVERICGKGSAFQLVLQTGMHVPLARRRRRDLRWLNGHYR